MNFEFSKNFQGFESSQKADLSLVSYQSSPALLCRCKESCDYPGIVRNINLPQLSEYTIKINGQADNSRTYVSICDPKGRPIVENQYYLPKKRGDIEIKFYARTSQIRLGIFMGGDSIAVPGNKFLIYNVRLNGAKKQIQNSQAEFKITRMFETVTDLEKEKKDPLRNNSTPMEVGEYAILKGHNKMDDLYVLGQKGLKYVSRIGSGLPTFFGEALHSIPGKEIPIYDDHNQAQKDLDVDPNNFYRPRGDYLWENQFQGDIYLYLDKQGYVRWLKYKNTNYEAEAEKHLEEEK